MAASVSAEKCVLTVWFYLLTFRCLSKLYLEYICNPRSLFQTRFTRMFAAVARRALQSSRNFSTSVARRGGDGLPPPGDNLPFSINNRYIFTLVYIGHYVIISLDVYDWVAASGHFPCWRRPQTCHLWKLALGLYDVQMCSDFNRW